MDKTQLYDRALNVYRQYVLRSLTTIDWIYYQDHELDIHDEFKDTLDQYDGDVEKFLKDWE